MSIFIASDTRRKPPRGESTQIGRVNGSRGPHPRQRNDLIPAARRRISAFYAWAPLFLMLGLPACQPLIPDDLIPPSAPVRSPEDFDTLSFGDFVGPLVNDPAAAKLDYWQSKPLPAALMTYEVDPIASSVSRDSAAHLLAGEFRPSSAFDWLDLGVPPPWDENPLDNTTWDFYRHSLIWLVPVAEVWADDDDPAARALVEEVITDWWMYNATRPGASPKAWSDHTAAYRLRVFCWLWELYRTGDDVDERFAALLMELIHSHAEFIAGGTTYLAVSNHALEQNQALLEAGVLYPEFTSAGAWYDLAGERTRRYLLDNFSEQGFHLEQSPYYHWYVLRRLGQMIEFLQANNEPLIAQLDETARKAASVWPYLIRPNRMIADIGDTFGRAWDYEKWYRQWWGDNVPQIAGPSAPDPRDADAGFLLDWEAGYAVFTAHPVATPNPQPDTYALFRCNNFLSEHYHTDALSFLLYGRGRDWLVDSGKYNYDYAAPERLYVVSPRAHNLVLIDNQEFTPQPTELVAWGRTESGDYVTSRHELPLATHTRRFFFAPPDTLEIDDELLSADGLPHMYAQLFHVAPDLEVEIISDRRADLVAPDGSRCILEQFGDAGRWEIITGQTEPYWQGWFSPAYQEIEPAPALHYVVFPPATECVFSTTIQLSAPESDAVKSE